MNLSEQISRHQVDLVWMPNPEAHLHISRDQYHFLWALEHLMLLQRVHTDPLKILDIGCYDGWLDFLLLQYPIAFNEASIPDHFKMRSEWHVHGLEIIPNLCASAEKYKADNQLNRALDRYKIIEGTLWGAGNPSKVDYDYHAVLCFEMLEHIPFEDVDAFLILMETSCRPGAQIFISLPDQRHEDNPQHLWTPTHDLIKEIFAKKKGFLLEYKSYPGTTVPGNFFISYLP